jgi:hypothetical protein
MATRVEMPSLSPSLAILPFLFMSSRNDDRDWQLNTALQAARAAEEALDEPRNCRKRVAWLLCETGAQYARWTGECSDHVPLSRQEIAAALGVSVCRVKRVMALLSLSGVVASEPRGLSILDWRRLCAIAGYDPGRLGFEVSEELTAAPDEEAPMLVTAAGDPAYFE